MSDQLSGVSRWVRFKLERWIQRGVLHQLLLMAGLVVAIAVGGGLVAALFTEKFEGVGPAIWWAFLRLTDPGYLGDDEGLVLRIVSVVVTVLGYVIFMGSLIAILTQWLARTIRRLESGLTPISMQDHVVILGWTNRTPEIVLRLLTAKGRLHRFLERRQVSKLRVVILAREVDVVRQLELREYLGEYWSPDQVFLRSGSSLHREHLQRLDLSRAAVVVIPGSDFELGGTELTDTRVVKTLLTLEAIFSASSATRPGHVVAEVFDSQKVPIAQNTMSVNTMNVSTTSRLDVIASDRVISRLISQSVRHPGVSSVLQMLSHREGESLYVRGWPELAGFSFAQLRGLFPHAVVLGVVRQDESGSSATLNPSPTEELRADDVLVFLASTFDRCVPSSFDPGPAPEVSLPLSAKKSGGPPCRVLVLGWSVKILAILSELGAARSERFAVTIMSRVPLSEREELLRRLEVDSGRVEISHIDGDYSIVTDFAQVDLSHYDDVLFLASGLMESSEGADARTILGLVLLRSILAKSEASPQVLVELLDPDNSRLFSSPSEILLISPRVMSHILAHVALRQELSAVFDALFRSGGSEVSLRSAEEYGLLGQSLDFAQLQHRAAEHDEIAMGLFRTDSADASGLNPARDTRWELTTADRIVVLAGRDGDSS